MISNDVDNSNVMININSEEMLRRNEDTKKREAEKHQDTGVLKVLINIFCGSRSRFLFLRFYHFSCNNFRALLTLSFMWSALREG